MAGWLNVTHHSTINLNRVLGCVTFNENLSYFETGREKNKGNQSKNEDSNSVQTQNYHKNIHFRTVRTQNYKKNTYFEIHNKGIQSKTRTLILFEPKTTTKIHILEQEST